MSITKLFGSYGFNTKSDSFNDEMKFFAKMSILDWCGVAYAAKQEPVSKIVSEMVKVDKEEAQKDLLLQKSGFNISSNNEQPPNI